MLKPIFIRHEDISDSKLETIIRIKTAAWPYTYEAHYKWISNNLTSSDIHVLLFDGETAIAYLNLIDIIVEFDSAKMDGWGIGNVCAIEKGNGWGKEIMLHVNDFLIENNKIGLLFCKNQLIKFYAENNWKLCNSTQLSISNIGPNVFTFIYNFPENFKYLKFEGKSF